MIRLIIYTITGSLIGLLMSFLDGPMLIILIEYLLGDIGAVYGSVLILFINIIFFGVLGVLVGSKFNKAKNSNTLKTNF